MAKAPNCKLGIIAPALLQCTLCGALTALCTGAAQAGAGLRCGERNSGASALQAPRPGWPRNCRGSLRPRRARGGLVERAQSHLGMLVQAPVRAACCRAGVRPDPPGRRCHARLRPPAARPGPVRVGTVRGWHRGTACVVPAVPLVPWWRAWRAQGFAGVGTAALGAAVGRAGVGTTVPRCRLLAAGGGRAPWYLRPRGAVPWGACAFAPASGSHSRTPISCSMARWRGSSGRLGAIVPITVRGSSQWHLRAHRRPPGSSACAGRPAENRWTGTPHGPARC
jgi:hypothetical protein